MSNSTKVSYEETLCESDSDDEEDIIFQKDSDDDLELKVEFKLPESGVIVLRKHVSFCNDVVVVFVPLEERKGFWAEDAFRFQQMCASVEHAIAHIFDEKYRSSRINTLAFSCTKSAIPQITRRDLNGFDHFIQILLQNRVTYRQTLEIEDTWSVRGVYRPNIPISGMITAARQIKEVELWDVTNYLEQRR